MKILIVQAAFGTGGAEKVVAMLAEHWCRAGHDVRVLGLNAASTDSYFPYPAGVSLHAAGSDGSGWKIRFRDVVRVRRLVGETQPDLVISFLTKVNATCALALMGTHVSLVVSERNNPDRQGGSPFWRHAGAWAAARARVCVMQTEAARSRLPSNARRRAQVIANPCRTGALPEPASDTRGGRATFVAVGRLDAQKGFDRLISAFAGLIADRPDAQLVIHGEGPEREALEASLRALGLQHAVALPGNTSRPGEWVRSGDVFVLSSRYEGYPNALMEAMAAGLPVVAFDCPWGPAEMIDPGRNGLLVPNGRTGDLTTAMRSLCDDPLLGARLGKQAREDAVRWSPETIFARWDDVLNSVVAVQPEDRAIRVAG